MFGKIGKKKQALAQAKQENQKLKFELDTSERVNVEKMVAKTRARGGEGSRPLMGGQSLAEGTGGGNPWAVTDPLGAAPISDAISRRRKLGVMK